MYFPLCSLTGSRSNAVVNIQLFILTPDLGAEGNY